MTPAEMLGIAVGGATGILIAGIIYAVRALEKIEDQLRTLNELLRPISDEAKPPKPREPANY